MRWVVLIVIVLAGLIAVIGANTSSTPSATDSTSTDSSQDGSANQTQSVYLGVTQAAVARIMGTPTNPEPADIQSGYGSCFKYPGFDAWKVGIDQTTGRVNYFAPRDGCTDTPPPWRVSAMQALPPDAKFMSNTDPQGISDTAEEYHSDWLNIRTGCGTIVIRGDDEGNGWVAMQAC